LTTKVFSRQHIGDVVVETEMPMSFRAVHRDDPKPVSGSPRDNRLGTGEDSHGFIFSSLTLGTIVAETVLRDRHEGEDTRVITLRAITKRRLVTITSDPGTKLALLTPSFGNTFS